MNTALLCVMLPFIDIHIQINNLGHERFIVREQAQTRLMAYGFYARPQLQQAAKSPDLEVVVRANRILAGMAEKIRVDPGYEILPIDGPPPNQK